MPGSRVAVFRSRVEQAFMPAVELLKKWALAPEGEQVCCTLSAPEVLKNDVLRMTGPHVWMKAAPPYDEQTELQ